MTAVTPERCPHCGVAPGDTHGVFCPNLPRGMFGSLDPYINTPTARESPVVEAVRFILYRMEHDAVEYDPELTRHIIALTPKGMP